MYLAKSETPQQGVGQTPLIEIHCRFRARDYRIHAKYESFNFSGSIKVRMALFILRRARQQAEIRPGDTIVEATSGKMGILFAALGRALPAGEIWRCPRAAARARQFAHATHRPQDWTASCPGYQFRRQFPRRVSCVRGTGCGLLCSDEECKPHYLTRDLKLLGFCITPGYRGSCA